MSLFDNSYQAKNKKAQKDFGRNQFLSIPKQHRELANKALIIVNKPKTTQQKPIYGIRERNLSFLLGEHDLDLFRDFYIVGVAVNDESFLMQVIYSILPDTILIVGNIAYNVFKKAMKYKQLDTNLLGYTGYVIPDKTLNSWIVFCPSIDNFFLDKEQDQQLFIRRYISLFAEYSRFNYEKKTHKMINDISERKLSESAAIEYIKIMIEEKQTVAYDYETNTLFPYLTGSKILSIGVCCNYIAFSFVYTEKIKPHWIKLLQTCKVIAHNMAFENLWNRHKFVMPHYPIFDTMLSSKVLDNRQGFMGLKKQTYLRLGVTDYDADSKQYIKQEKHGFNRMKEMPTHKLLEYNLLDAKYTYILYLLHAKELKQFDYSHKGFTLLMQGTIALNDDMYYGIRLSRKSLIKDNNTLEKKRNKLLKKLEKSKIGKRWYKLYRHQTNFKSSTQLSNLLKGLKIDTKQTATGQIDTSKKNLLTIIKENNNPALTTFITNLLDIKKYEKIQSTYITNWLSLKQDRLYPEYVLFPISYRSSSRNPNFQNIPVRDEDYKKVVRKALFPDYDHCLLEADYASVEVRISACYHKDENMLKYILDPHTDMHRDCAQDVYKLDEKQVTKQIRQGVKGCFVFPNFYGSYWKKTGVDLYEWAKDCNLDDGTPLLEYMQSKNIGTLDSFLQHVEQVESIFWLERFPQYTKWKEKVYDHYLKYGYVQLKTGFKCRGPMRKTQVINVAIQGTAFHCLLQSKIWIHQYLHETGLIQDIRPIGQVHDSCMFTINPDYIQDFVYALRSFMIDRLQDHWKWIIVPLDIEVDTTPVNKPWYYKTEYKEKKEINQ